MTWLLIRNKFKRAAGAAAKLTAGQKVTAVLFQLVILLFMTFLAAFFYAAFYVLRESEAGLGGIIYLINHLFFLIFVLAVVSSAISSVYMLFRGREVAFLISLPLSSRSIFDYLYAQTVIFNTWPIAVVGVPLALSLTFSLNLSPAALLLMLLGLVPLVFIAESAGVLLALVAAKLFSGFRARAAAIGALLGGAGLAYYLAEIITPSRLGELLTTDVGAAQGRFIASSKIDQLWLPNYWLSEIYRVALGGEFAAVLGPLAVLALAVLLIGAATRRVGAKMYYDAWADAQEMPHRDRRGRRGGFPRVIPGLEGALVERDYLAFSRNTNEVSQAGFIFILVLLFIFIISRSSQLNLDSGLWGYRTVVFIFGVITYFLAMIANRFVFPSLGLEGRSFWILLSSPLGLDRLFWAKLIYSAAILSGLGAALMAASAYFLKINGELVGLMMFSVVVSAVTVSAITLGMGFLFPDFSRKNPAELSSSLAGLSATILCLIYGGLGMFLIAPIAAGFYLDRPSSILSPLITNLALSLTLIIAFSARALSKIKNFAI